MTWTCPCMHFHAFMWVNAFLFIHCAASPFHSFVTTSMHTHLRTAHAEGHQPPSWLTTLRIICKVQLLPLALRGASAYVVPLSTQCVPLPRSRPTMRTLIVACRQERLMHVTPVLLAVLASGFRHLLRSYVVWPYFRAYLCASMRNTRVVRPLPSPLYTHLLPRAPE